MKVDKRQHKGSQGEGTQAQRCWVGKLAMLDRLVKTGLELSTEGWKTAIGRVLRIKERVPAIVETVHHMFAIDMNARGTAGLLVNGGSWRRGSHSVEDFGRKK